MKNFLNGKRLINENFKSVIACDVNGNLLKINNKNCENYNSCVNNTIAIFSSREIIKY